MGQKCFFLFECGGDFVKAINLAKEFSNNFKANLIASFERNLEFTLFLPLFWLQRIKSLTRCQFLEYLRHPNIYVPTFFPSLRQSLLINSWSKHPLFIVWVFFFTNFSSLVILNNSRHTYCFLWRPVYNKRFKVWKITCNTKIKQNLLGIP